MIKIDLHHHLDGAFRLDSLYDEAKRRGLPQGKLDRQEFYSHARVRPGCNSLTEFLETFHFFYDIAQDSGFIERSACEIVEDMH